MARLVLSRSVIVAVILCLGDAGQAQTFPVFPRREVRAVWITTAAGLDWPRTVDRVEQQASLRAIIMGMKAAHFNTLLFQVRARGDAYYRSSYEPWAENLTGTLGRDPGWDPLAFLLDEAHRSGLEVHAWFNVFKVRGPSPVTESMPLHPTLRFSTRLYDVGGDGWLDPGAPEVRAYLVRVALELVREYDIDGINFDFLRYPGKDFPDTDTYRRFGHGGDRDNWRRSNIDAFVAAFYDSAMQIKPMLKVGSSPLGVFNEGTGSHAWGAYSSYYQDSRGWALKGQQDYLSPQVYWDIGATKDDPDFADLVRTWTRTSSGRQIWAGIGAYKPEVLRELPREIDSARSIGADGQAYFRYEFVRDPRVLGGRYAHPANIPPMTWKDSIPPGVPTDLAATETSPNIIRLAWQAPAPARDGDRASRYNIYRSKVGHIDIDNASLLLAITSDNSTSFVDTIAPGGDYRYFYAVSALDKGNNESPLSTVASVVLTELVQLRDKLLEFTSLSASVSHDGRATLIAYKIAVRSQVSLRAVTQAGDSTKGELVLANGLQDAGTYVVGIPRDRLEPGPYSLRLTSGDVTIEHPLRIEP